MKETKNKIDNHEEIMSKDDKDIWELDRETFNKVTNKIKLSNKNMYKHFIKSGEKYKDAIFLYMKKLIQCENIPTDFALTTLIQIWKRKGSALDLNNMRFIHLRHWHCKLLEALITEKMKNNIVDNTPKIQLGGMPGSSSVEHLVVLKTWMKQNEQLKKPGIFNTFDMAKFFDKESLIDCMYSLSKYAKIDNKSYRIWYKINQNTRICVNTSVGTSDYRYIDDSVGQGQVGAALVSSLSIGCAVEEVFRGIISATIGKPSLNDFESVNLNSVIFQDDIGKMSDNLDDAKIGSQILYDTLCRKVLSVNYDKSKYIIFGSKSQRDNLLNKLKDDPIKMGNTNLPNTKADTYLGDVIHQEGCEKSITETIDARIKKQKNKVEEIIQLAESPVMSITGNSVPAFKLYESIVIPSLLHNCESWIGLTDKHISTLQDFQNDFIRRVLRIPDSTPKSLIQWDVGLLPMKWRIGKSKLNFVSKIMKKDRSNLCRKTIVSEVLNNIKGLGYECSILCNELGLDNILTSSSTKSDIKNAIYNLVTNETRRSMQDSAKVADRLTDNPEDNNYLNTLPLHSSRLWFRYRARAIKGVKYSCKSSYTDLSCRFCDKEVIETQEHLEEACEGNTYERRGLRNLAERDWKDILKFWERMSIKLERRKAEDQANKKKEEEKQKKANEEEKNKVVNVNTVLNVIIAAVVSDTLT